MQKKKKHKMELLKCIVAMQSFSMFFEIHFLQCYSIKFNFVQHSVTEMCVTNILKHAKQCLTTLPLKLIPAT